MFFLFYFPVRCSLVFPRRERKFYRRNIGNRICQEDIFVHQREISSKVGIRMHNHLKVSLRHSETMSIVVQLQTQWHRTFWRFYLAAIHVLNKSNKVRTIDAFSLTACVLVSKSSFKLHTFLFLMLFCSNSAHFSEIQLVCDGRTDRRTDRRTDGHTLL